MTRGEALAVAEAIVAEGGSVCAYARRHGLHPVTLLSQAWRAGVRLGVEVRRLRLAQCEQLRASGYTCEKAAHGAGFSSASAMHRARKSVRRWRDLEKAA